MTAWQKLQKEVFSVFLRWLNGERQAAYSIAECPDVVDRQRPAIDYVLRDVNTGREIGVEQTSAWRSTAAPKEEAYWLQFVESVKADMRGEAPGRFLVWIDARVPQGVGTRDFSAALATFLHRSEIRSLTSNSKTSTTLVGLTITVERLEGEGTLVEF